MSDISFAMKYAKSHIEMYEDHGDVAFDIAEHEQAMDCWNCQSFIQMGIDAYKWLIKTDVIFRKLAYTSDRDNYDAEPEKILQDLFIRWMTPCDFANDWIDEQYKRGFNLENLNEFRDCEREMRAIVGSFDESDELPKAMQNLQDEALRDHRNGETSEFV